MPNVKLTGNIGRRHYDDEGFLIGVYLRLEITLLQPELIPLLLYLAWLIGLGHFLFTIWGFCHEYLFLV
jgi:hypothetical protein